MINDLLKSIHRRIDISCVKSNNTLSEIDQMVSAAQKYQFICAFSLPFFTPYLVEKLKDEPNIIVGGTVGFPSGCDTTASKVFQAKELSTIGCGELDMVINVAQLKSNNIDDVYYDIKAVKDAVGEKPIKAILEVTLLTDEEIVKGSRIAVEAGASYIKTGTGWCTDPTTVRHIKIIKSAVGDEAQIKGAGGIRTLDTILEMAEAGCDRFGMGMLSAIDVMEQVLNKEGRQ